MRIAGPIILILVGLAAYLYVTRPGSTRRAVSRTGARWRPSLRTIPGEDEDSVWIELRHDRPDGEVFEDRQFEVIEPKNGVFFNEGEWDARYLEAWGRAEARCRLLNDHLPE